LLLWFGLSGLVTFLCLAAEVSGSKGPEESPGGRISPGPSSEPLRITILKSRDIPPYESALRGFYRELQLDGGGARDLILTLEGSGSTREQTLQTLRQSDPDLILTLGTAATRAVIDTRPDVPVIFSLVLLSSSQQILEDARRDGLAITGAAMDIPVRLQFQKARELLPALRRIGVFYNPAETGALIEEAREVAADLGLELVAISVGSEADLYRRLDEDWPEIDLLWSVADSSVFTQRTGREILLQTLRRKVPFIGLSPSFVKAGALMSFSCKYEAVGAQAAEKARRIVGGEPAWSIRMSSPGEVSYFLNMRTAKKIGVEVPREFLEAAEVLF
jgi:putative ABC transport system substrate-binding protein